MKKILNFLLLIVTVTIMGGCFLKKDEEPKELTQEEMFLKYKEGYDKANLYNEDFTEKYSTIVKKYGEISENNSEEISYKQETNEGYYKTKDFFENTMYVVKNANGYTGYYSSLSEIENYYDLFDVDDTYFDKFREDERIKKHFFIESVSNCENVNTYANNLKDKIAKQFVGFDFAMKTYSANIINDNGNYIFNITFNQNINALNDIEDYEGKTGKVKVEVKILFNDNSINKYEMRFEEILYTNKSSTTIAKETTKTISYENKFSSNNMNYDIAKYDNKLSGDMVNVEYRIVEGQSIKASGKIAAKVDQNILERVSNIEEYYSEKLGVNIRRWYRSSGYSSNIEENSVFSILTTFLYADAIDAGEYSIYLDNSIDNGNVTVSDTYADSGDVVKVEYLAYPGYELNELYYVKVGSTTKYSITNGSFIMPSCNINIYATFIEK